MASAKVRGISIELSADTTGIIKGLKKANTSIINTQKQLKDVDKLLKLDPKNTELLAQKQRLLSDAISQTKDKLKLLEDAAEQAAKGLQDGTMTQEQYDAIQREIASTTDELKRLEDQAKKTSKGFGDIAAAGDKVKKVGDKIADVGKSMSVVSAGIGAIGAGAVASFNEVDEGLDTVVTKTGATGDALDSLQTSMKNVYGSMAVTAEDAGIAIGEVNTRFGLTGQTLEDVSTVFLEFANINGTDLNSAIDSVDSIMHKFGVNTEDTASVLGLMTSVGQATAVSMETLESALEKNGASLQEMGFGLEESINLLGMMEANGVDTATAMTGLKKAVTNAAKDGKSADEALQQTIDSIKNASSETEALTIATEQFGSRGAAEMASAIRDGRLSVDELSASLEDYGSVVSDTYNATLSLPDQATVAMNNLKLAGAELGDTFMTMIAPALTEVIEGLKQAVAWFGGLDDKTKRTIITVAGIVAAIGPVLIVIGKVVSAIGSLMIIIPKINAAIGTFNAVLAANPIILIVTAIAALIASLVYLWNNCEGFRKFVLNALDSIVKTTKKAIDTFKKYWMAFVKVIYNTCVNLAKWFKDLWNGIKNTYQSVATWFKTLFTNALNGIKSVWNGAVSFFSGIWTKIKGVFGAVSSFFSSAFQSAYSAVTNAFSGIVVFFSEIWSKIKSTFSDLGTSIGNAISGAVKTAINSVISKIESTINSAIGLINGAIGIINKLPGVSVKTISKLSLPRLAKGGLVDGTTIAMIGEAGREAVLPLERNTQWMDVLADKIGERNNVTINMEINGAVGQDVNQLADVVMNRMKFAVKQKGAIYA